MKKVTSIMTMLCCLVGMFLIPTASATDLSVTVTNGELCHIDSRDTLTPIHVSVDETQATSVEPRIKTGPSTVAPEYVYVFPVAYVGGEYQIPDMGYRFVPTSGVGYIRGSLSRANQDTLKNYLIGLGYEPVGWYIEGSYYIDSYRPEMFRYYTHTHDGKSNQLGATARNGSNVFGVLGLFPQDTSVTYNYGITGTVSFYSYWPSISSNPMVHGELAIELSVDFKNT